VGLSATDVNAGQSVTFTGTLQTAANAGGTIQFQDNGLTFGSALVNSNTATFSTGTLAGGTHSITAYYLGDGGHAAATSPAISLVIHDFSISGTTMGNLVVTRGGSASSTITIAPIAGFSNTVSFSCAVPPAMAEASCSVTSAQLTGTSSQNATLNVTTTAPHQAMVVDPIRRFTTWTGIAFGIAFIGGGCCRRRRKTMKAAILGLLLIGVVVLCTCGGGSGGSGNPGGTQTDQGTPLGTYTLTITAASGTISHSMTQTVIVQ
jgi:hypothetical protein